MGDCVRAIPWSDLVNNVIISRGSFLLCCLGQLMTGVTTGEADLTQLLGCSASDWAGVRAEARSQGRVSVRARRQVRGSSHYMSRGSVFRLSSRAASLSW